jgi:hypothetical protein
VNAGNAAGSGAIDAAGTAGSGVTTAAGNAGAGVTGAAGTANSGLDPYAATGAQASQTLGGMLAPGGSLTKQFSAGDMEANDPGYAFRLQQQNQAMQRSAAASGSAMGGGTLKALASYSGNLASQEYGAAFNRFTQSQQQQYNFQSGAADRGLNAATTQGANTIGAAAYTGNQNVNAATYTGNAGINAAQYAGNAGMQTNEYAGTLATAAAGTAGGMQIGANEYAGTAGMQSADLQASNTLGAARYNGDAMMQAGNAKAAGDIGSANAWSSAIGGIAGGVGSLITGGFSGGGGFNLGNMMRGYPAPTGSSSSDGGW